MSLLEIKKCVLFGYLCYNLYQRLCLDVDGMRWGRPSQHRNGSAGQFPTAGDHNLYFSGMLFKTTCRRAFSWVKLSQSIRFAGELGNPM